MMITKATSPQDIERSRRAAFALLRMRAHFHEVQCSRGFSLIEVLLAIFILGIGVISIAALFPAGIAQQRLSVDDMMGPIVADNAIEIIRSKVKPDDFGTFEDLGGTSRRYTIPGDWSWGRPMLFRTDATVTPPGFPSFNVKAGSISIFKIKPSTLSPNSALTSADEIPWNALRYGNNPANPPNVPIIITQRERYFPMASESVSETVRPQYVWDCMFRRFGGKIMVAIFVYRVTVPGGGAAPNYVVAADGSSNVPPLPVWLDLVADPDTGASPPDYSAGGPWDVGLIGNAGSQPPADANNRAIVFGTKEGISFNPDDVRQAWQQPRQWMIDQNNNVHRVIGQTRDDYDNNTGKVKVELVRPPTPVLGLKLSAGNVSLPTNTPYYYRPAQTSWAGASYTGWVNDDVVTDIWYIPLTDANGLTLTPVYATVKEL